MTPLVDDTDAWHAACADNSSALAALQMRTDLLWNTLVKDTDFMSRSIFSLAELGVGNDHVMALHDSAPVIEHDCIRRLIADLRL